MKARGRRGCRERERQRELRGGRAGGSEGLPVRIVELMSGGIVLCYVYIGGGLMDVLKRDDGLGQGVGVVAAQGHGKKRRKREEGKG